MSIVDYMVGRSLKKAYEYKDILTDEQFCTFTDKVRLYVQSYSLNVLEQRNIESQDLRTCESIVNQIYNKMYKDVEP